MTAPTARELKIKTGVVQRLGLELVSYKEELADNLRRTAEVRASNNHSKLKQWENVCAETQGMIPDTQNRLQAALAELKTLVNAPELSNFSEMADARGEVEKAESLLAARMGNGH